MGKLIVIEGACDSVGKSTQSDLLMDRLRNEGKTVLFHHFPTYDENRVPVDPEVRKLLDPNDPTYKNSTPYEANRVFAHDRQTVWEEKFKFTYDDPNNMLLFDRYTTSSIIYQSSKMPSKEEIKKFIKDVYHYEFDELNLPRPDLVVFLYVGFDLAMKLMDERDKKANIKKDTFEADPELMKRVYENAMFVADYLNWPMVKCDDASGKMRPREDIHEEVYRLVKKMDN
ncbi:MAG: hypothetical protein IKH36_00615 [Bacilli bacterium]|nr:hypothetical protein [Bacilli bacterium]